MAAETFDEWWNMQMESMKEQGLRQAFLERECDHMIAAIAWGAATEVVVKKFTSTNSQSATALLSDDKLAESIAVKCLDPMHDDRWCQTCSARQDGINDYRDNIIKRLNSEAELRT